MTTVMRLWASPHFLAPRRFALVGLSGVAVNMLVLMLLIDGLRLAEVVSSVIATETAIINNFIWNDRWTFRGASPDVTLVERLVRYNLAAFGGLLIGVGTFSVLAQRLDLHHVVANAIAIVAGFGWNYIASRYLVWKSRFPTISTR